MIETLQDVINQCKAYYNDDAPFSYPSSTTDQAVYWTNLPSTQQTNPLKLIAMKVFSIVIHSRGVESLFSIMAYFKNKSRNKMAVSTLEMLAQLKLMLMESDLPQTRIRAARHSSESERIQSNLDGINTSQVMEVLCIVL